MVVGVLSRIFKARLVPGRKIKRVDALLALFTVFRQHGRPKVSLSEFQVAVADWQIVFPLGYKFSTTFLYSYDLFEDLRTLEYDGEVYELAYRHDGFLPKNFVELSRTGFLRGEQILADLSEEDRVALESAVKKAVKHYYHTWRLWSRPEASSESYSR